MDERREARGDSVVSMVDRGKGGRGAASMGLDRGRSG